jgi:hypothetical protein
MPETNDSLAGGTFKSGIGGALVCGSVAAFLGAGGVAIVLAGAAGGLTCSCCYYACYCSKK